MSLYVNGEKIEDRLIEAEIHRLRPSYQQVFADQPESQQETQLAEWARENLIEAALFRQQARKQFPDIDPQQVRQALEQMLAQESANGVLHQRLEAGPQEQQKVQDEIADHLRQQQLHAQIAESVRKPSEKDILRHYDRYVDQRYTIPETIHAAHIVKHPSRSISKDQQYQQMCEAKQKLDSGVPFEQLAREMSDCPENAGDLGFFARGRMVPRFEEIAFALETGAYSDIFETEFGWHIVKVLEKRPSMPCPLEQVHEMILQELTRQAQEKAMEQFLDAQKEIANIEER